MNTRENADTIHLSCVCGPSKNFSKLRPKNSGEEW
jgi:hypothetical protein